MEKGSPHYALERIKEEIAQSGIRVFTRSALRCHRDFFQEVVVMTTRTCMHCEAGKMNLVARTVNATLDGFSREVADVHGWFCDQCGEIEFADSDSAARYAAAMDALVIESRKERGREVRRIRTRLKLTQKAAAEVFGGGVNAFSRYERGEVEPPRAVVKFLRVLDRHPDLLDEVKRA
jgi:HTH-type transcriptional regulator / antitoxin MqsA